MRQLFLQMCQAICLPKELCQSAKMCASVWRLAVDISQTDISTPQVLIVQWCVQTVWRTGTVTPKTPTTWATSLDLWLARSTSGRTASLQPTLTVTHWSSRTQSYTKPICAMGHPTASKRTYKETHFPINTICYILIEKWAARDRGTALHVRPSPSTNRWSWAVAMTPTVSLSSDRPCYPMDTPSEPLRMRAPP